MTTLMAVKFIIANPLLSNGWEPPEDSNEDSWSSELSERSPSLHLIGFQNLERTKKIPKNIILHLRTSNQKVSKFLQVFSAQSSQSNRRKSNGSSEQTLIKKSLLIYEPQSGCHINKLRNTDHHFFTGFKSFTSKKFHSECAVFLVRKQIWISKTKLLK